MAVVFHDDCSSFEDWIISNEWGELKTDGSCFYVEQELYNGKYISSVSMYKRLDFFNKIPYNAEFSVSLPKGEGLEKLVFGLIFYTDTEQGAFSLIIMKEDPETPAVLMFGVTEEEEIESIPYSLSQTQTLNNTYRIEPDEQHLCLYENNVLLKKVDLPEASRPDYASLSLMLYHVSDGDNSNGKAPALCGVTLNGTLLPPHEYAKGLGTKESPYEVQTAEDLNAIRRNLTSHFIQTNKIDLSSWGVWNSIGDSSYQGERFSGSYDGQGYKISNLKGNALFGYIEFAVLRNIGLEDVYIDKGIASLADSMMAGLVENCYSTGVIINDNEYFGSLSGLVGGGQGWYQEGQEIELPTIQNCYSLCEVRFTERPMVSSYSTYGVGGLVADSSGYTFSGPNILNCYAAGNIYGAFEDERIKIGGLVGKVSSYDRQNILEGNYYDSTVSGCSDAKGATPKTTVQMKQQATFIDWDFDTVWGIDPAINDGYPYLKVFQQGDPIIDDVIPQYVPQSSIKLTFTAGDSDPYDMGTYYADKSQHKVGQGTTKINARNSVGKYLKDQSFDENCNYPAQAAHDLLESILSAAGLTNYYVAADTTQLGFNFPPNKLLLDGLDEVIQYLPGWQIREEVGGKVVVAKYDNAEFTQPSTYTFQRDRDIFSREQVVDDRSIYGRVCVHTGDFTVKVYRPITSNLGWSPPARKTLYQKVPDGTTSQEAAAIATSLAESMSNSGRVETFVCAFRPQIIPGDGAEILDSTGAVTLGIITQVKHTFGTQGFYSEIVVDSGGRIGKIKFKDIVNSLQPLPETVKN